MVALSGLIRKMVGFTGAETANVVKHRGRTMKHENFTNESHGLMGI